MDWLTQLMEFYAGGGPQATGIGSASAPAPHQQTLRDVNDTAANDYDARAQTYQSQGLSLQSNLNTAMARNLRAANGPYMYSGFADPNLPVDHPVNRDPAVQASHPVGTAGEVAAAGSAAPSVELQGPDLNGGPGFRGALQGLPNARLYNNGGDTLHQGSGPLGSYANWDLNKNSDVTPVLAGGWVKMPKYTQDQLNNPSQMPSGHLFPEQPYGIPRSPSPMFPGYLEGDTSAGGTETGPDILKSMADAVANSTNGGGMPSLSMGTPTGNPFAGMVKGGAGKTGYASQNRGRAQQYDSNNMPIPDRDSGAPRGLPNRPVSDSKLPDTAAMLDPLDPFFAGSPGSWRKQLLGYQ